MKHLLLPFLTLLFLFSCKKDDNDPVPEPEPTYYSFEGAIGTHDNSTIIAADQNLLICGFNLGNLSLLKISKSGTTIWQKEFDVQLGFPPPAIIQSPDQNLFICGDSYRNVFESGHDVLLVKTNPSGDTLWTKTYGGNSDDYGYYLRNSLDGNLLICGTSFSQSTDHASDIYILKVTLDGDTIWTKTFVDPGVESAYHLLQLKNGDILITGTEHSVPHKVVYLLKLNTEGIPIWEQKISSADAQLGFSTIELPGGDLVICGKRTRDDYDNILVIKTDHEGTVYWQKEYGEDGLSEEGRSIKMNGDGSFSIAGSSYEPHSGQHGIILLKIDAEGNQLLLKNFGSNFIDAGENLLKDENDDNIITGTYNNNIFMTRTDNNGVFK